MGAEQELCIHIQQLQNNTEQCLKYSIAGGTEHAILYLFYIKLPLDKKTCGDGKNIDQNTNTVLPTECSIF